MAEAGAAAEIEGRLQLHVKTFGPLRSWKWKYYRLTRDHFLHMNDQQSTKITRSFELERLVSCIVSIEDKRKLLVRFEDDGPLADRSGLADEVLELRAEDADTAEKWGEAFAPHVSAARKHRQQTEVPTSTVPVSFDSDVFASDSKSITKEGYLWKRAVNSGRNWKRRYFILFLNEGRISYFTDRASAANSEEPKRNLLLSKDSTVNLVKGKQPHAFVVDFPAESAKLFIRAESAEEMHQWIANIRTNVEERLKEELQKKGHSPAEATRMVKRERRTSLVEMNGYLLKRAIKSGRNWKRRYFKLKENMLSYYTDEYAVRKKHGAKGVLKLTPDTRIQTGPEAKAEEEELQRQAEARQEEARRRGEELNLPLIFERALWETGSNVDKVIVITTPTAKLFVKAKTVEEMTAWHSAFNTSLRRVSIARSDSFSRSRPSLDKASNEALTSAVAGAQGSVRVGDCGGPSGLASPVSPVPAYEHEEGDDDSSDDDDAPPPYEEEAEEEKLEDEDAALIDSTTSSAGSGLGRVATTVGPPTPEAVAGNVARDTAGAVPPSVGTRMAGLFVAGAGAMSEPRATATAADNAAGIFAAVVDT